MFCSRKLNHRINRLHERALQITYSDYVSSFEEILLKDKSTTIHQKNLRVVAVEMYEISRNMSPIFMEDLVTDIDTKYHTRFRCKVELDDNCNATCSKKLNYYPKKANTSFFWTSII